MGGGGGAASAGAASSSFTATPSSAEAEASSASLDEEGLGILQQMRLLRECIEDAAGGPLAALLPAMAPLAAAPRSEEKEEEGGAAHQRQEQRGQRGAPPVSQLRVSPAVSEEEELAALMRWAVTIPQGQLDEIRTEIEGAMSSRGL